jgi:hypothetical protein
LLPETESQLFTRALLDRVQLFSATASESAWLATQDDRARKARQLATTAFDALSALHVHLGECWEKSHPKRGAAVEGVPVVVQDERDELAGPQGVTTVENAYRGKKRGRKTQAEREALAMTSDGPVGVSFPPEASEDAE